MEYKILEGNKEIGKARVEKTGLYYRISCQCRAVGRQHMRLGVTCGDQRIDLGVCIPEGDVLRIETSVPVKRLGEGALHFFVIDNMAGANWVELKSNSPCGCLEVLHKTRLEMRQGRVGLRLPFNHRQ